MGMQKYKLFLFFIFINGLAFAQKDVSAGHGTIKISKPKPDSIYIKAEMVFQQFQEGNKNNAQPTLIPFSMVTAPFPKVSGYAVPFDYDQFCNKNIEINKRDLGNKIRDTVHIQIKVLDNGKVYYKDITSLLVMRDVPAYYDGKMNAFKLDAIHLKCMNVLKQIKQWEPAYMVIGVKDTFKKVTVIKPKKKNLSATGILTIVFSTTPFED